MGATDSNLYTYRLDLEYDGTDYAGWQLQEEVRTVQGVVEASVFALFQEECRVHAGGRTDAGVHASGQVAHFRAAKHRDPASVKRALNAILPYDVRVRDVTLVGHEFHSRFSAKWRGYEYRIAREPIAVGRQYAWYCPRRLDLTALNLAAGSVVGTHRFRSFSHYNPDERHYLSDVYDAKWNVSNDSLIFHIEANRFLHGMVRLLVGTFVWAGSGKIDPGSIPQILAAQDIAHAGPKAPACGLNLKVIGYAPWPQVAQPGNEKPSISDVEND